MTPLSIIVVTHNRLHYTQRTIESLNQTVPNSRIVVIDNNSTEAGMKEYLVSLSTNFKSKDYGLIPPAFVIFNKENLGWAAAVNIALKHCITEYILVSNNDCIYSPGWYEKCLALYNKYEKIGILGVWKHRSHGVRQDLGDLVIKDDMPAVGWLLKRSLINIVGAFTEKGPCFTKGGNGEDTTYVLRTQEKGFVVAAPKEDVAQHIDGY